MEWHQVVKLPSATIPCFFRLLFVGRKRQGLILSRSRLDRVAFGLIWLRLPAWCVRMQMDAHDAFASNLPPFLPPLSPTTPITPYNPPNSPPQTNKLFEAPTQKWCDNWKWQPNVCTMILSPYNPLSPKATPLVSRADRRRELAWGSGWQMVYDYSRHGELTSFCIRLNMYKCCIAYSYQNAMDWVECHSALLGIKSSRNKQNRMVRVIIRNNPWLSEVTISVYYNKYCYYTK